jgi:hypothetical protein
MTTATEPRTLQSRLTRIGDPAHRWKVLKRTAMLYLAMTEASLTVDDFRREQYAEHVDRVPVPTTEDEYAALLERVRTTAVAEHENSRFGSNNCHEGTQAFLEAFGLERIECCEDAHDYCDSDCDECYPGETYTVTVTMSVTLTVRSQSGMDYVENDVREYLRASVSTSSVDDVEDTSNVEITDVTVDYA